MSNLTSATPVMYGVSVGSMYYLTPVMYVVLLVVWYDGVM